MSQIDQCPNCGGNYINKSGLWVCECCGAPRPELLTNEEQFSLLTAAKELRSGNFDLAEDLYLDFISRYPKNHAGYWGLVLTQYGIRYEEDYNGKKIPTCNATSINSFLEDKNYLKAVKLAPSEVASFYLEQAKIIDENRKQWLAIAKNEPPYDIFFSYKDTEDDRITRTKDSYDVQDLYTYLRDKGYRVFYSRESLRDKIAQQYEPYIFNALNTAAVMIVYGSSPEVFSSGWIKNEWQRYYKKIQSNLKQRDSLIVAFSGLDPSSLPRPLNTLQCMDANRKTFFLDLDKHIESVISRAQASGYGIERIEIKGGQVAKRAKVAPTEQIKIRELGSAAAAGAVSMDEAGKSKLALKYIEQGLPKNASRLVDEILNVNPQNALALWCNLMLQLGIKTQNELLERKNLEKLSNVSVLGKIIDGSDQRDAKNFLQLFYTAGILMLPTFSDNAYELIKLLLSYNSDGRSQFIRDVSPVIIDSNNSKFFDLLLSITDPNDIDRHLELMQGFAEAHLKAADFDVAAEYFRRMLEIDEGAVIAHKGLLACLLKQKYINKFKTKDVILLNDHLDYVENILRYTPAEDDVTFLSTLLNNIIDLMREYEADVPRLCMLYERLLKYLPNEMRVDKYLSFLATTLVEIGSFKLAEKYCMILLTYDGEKYMAYWLLMRVKLGCRYDNDLVLADTNITDVPDYDNSLACASSLGYDSFIDNAISISRKQQDSLEIKNQNKLQQKMRDDERAQRETEQAKTKRAQKRKLIKHRLIRFIIFAAIIGLIIGLCLAYSEKTQGDFKLKRTSGGYEVVGFSDNYDGGDVSVPAYYDGKPVIGVADGAFKDKTDLKTVYLPSTLKYIGNSAFEGCSSLSNVAFGATELDKIGKYAFKNCSSLKKFFVPKNVTYVGEQAFSYTNDSFVVYVSATANTTDWHSDWDKTYTANGWFGNKKTKCNSATY